MLLSDFRVDAAFGGTGPHPRYFLHVYAGDVGPDSLVVPDISGFGNHGRLGANLSLAESRAVAGYLTTDTPVGGSTDACIRFPNLNFDYASGEGLFVFWMGKMAAPGGSTSWLGDGAAALAGVQFRAKANGRFDIAACDGSARSFSVETTTVIADGGLHSFACAIRGSDRKYAMWADGLLTVAAFDQWSNLGGGESRDTRNSRVFSLGSSSHTSFVSTDGIACSTRALAVLRFAVGDVMPSLAKLTQVVNALIATPNRLIARGAL